LNTKGSCERLITAAVIYATGGGDEKNIFQRIAAPLGSLAYPVMPVPIELHTWI
jgi:hypothetical protein